MRKLARLPEAPSRPAPPLVYVHPTALCESAEVGPGTRIWAFAHVMAGASIGRDCNICDHAFVESGARIGHGATIKNRALIWDGVTLEDNVFIGPGVTFTNDRYPRSRHLVEAGERYEDVSRWLAPTVVKHGASIGAGAVILCGITIGAFAGVGAGATVTKDVPDHCLVVGQPARIAGRLCRCGVSLDSHMRCPQCGWSLRRSASAVSHDSPPTTSRGAAAPCPTITRKAVAVSVDPTA